MQKIKFPGYEYIGNFETPIIDYNNPKNQRKVILEAFVESRTGNIYVGNKRPQIEQEKFIRNIGKAKQSICHDISQTL